MWNIVRDSKVSVLYINILKNNNDDVENCGSFKSFGYIYIYIYKYL